MPDEDSHQHRQYHHHTHPGGYDAHIPLPQLLLAPARAGEDACGGGAWGGRRGWRGHVVVLLLDDAIFGFLLFLFIVAEHVIVCVRQGVGGVGNGGRGGRVGGGVQGKNRREKCFLIEGSLIYPKRNFTYLTPPKQRHS